MRTTIRLALLVAVAAAAASVEPLHSAAGARTATTNFRAAFTETNTSVTNRVADLGVFQLINTASGTVDGYGPATVVLAMSQDRSVEPCGPGSWTNAGTRRIVFGRGVLVLHEVAEVCDTEIGLVARGTWTADGTSSTGAFAGSWGSGRTAVYLPARLATLTGTLRLRHDDR
jgi:hypothetical protein